MRSYATSREVPRYAHFEEVESGILAVLIYPQLTSNLNSTVSVTETIGRLLLG